MRVYWRVYSGLGVILLIYTFLALAYSLYLPLHKAPDEIAHFQYSRFIAQTDRLPLTLAEREVAGYKSYQPPLYHSLVAALTGWSDNIGPPYLKYVWESPRFDLALDLLGTKRLANTEDELRPYQGAVLMWHLGRAVSIICSLGVIVITFITTLEFWPGQYHLALLAAAIIAFVPTFIFISASMSYEPLSALLIGIYFWLLLRLTRSSQPWWFYLLLGLIVGLAIMAKYAAIVLPIEVFVVFGYLAFKQKWGWSKWFHSLTRVGLGTLFTSGWWFLFLMINFNEIDQSGVLLGLLKPMLAGGGDTTQNYIAFALSDGQIGRIQSLEIVSESSYAWVWRTFQTFWTEKIGVYALSPVAHLLVVAVIILAMMGIIRRWRFQPEQRPWLGLLIFHVLLFLVLPLVRFLVQGRLEQTAQGRHILFPIATMFPLLLLYGCRAYLSLLWQRRLTLALIGGVMVWSVIQLLQLATYYSHSLLPVRTTPVQITHSLDKTFGDHLRLIGYDLALSPDYGAVRLSLYWQSPSYPDEDYRVRVKLVQSGTTYLEWLAYPANGRYPTRIWENWETIRDDYTFPMYELPPGDYEVQLQLVGAFEQLQVNEKESLSLAQFTLPASSVALHPRLSLSISAEGREIVQGVSLWEADQYRALKLPEFQPRMAIPLVWAGRPQSDERVEWLLVNNQGQVYSGRQASAHFIYFMVGPDWPPGDYHLRAEVWRNEQVIASQETASLVTIINDRPRLTQPPMPPHPLEANFKNTVKLLGYDLPVRHLTVGEGLPVTLYWQGLRTMGQSYTVFTKLFDVQQHAWASAERLPADGYHTYYWLENEVVVDGFELPINPATPAGVYWLNVGLYQQIGQSAVSLPLMIDGIQAAQTSITFGPIKIGEPPPGVVVNQISPEYPLQAKFGDIISLQGYNLRQAVEKLELKLYWESLAPTNADYTLFVHLRNQADETVAQMDQPVTNNVYPSSLWSPGEFILDTVTIPLPTSLPSGEYLLRVGLYDFTTGQRLPVVGSTDNSLLLTRITIPVDE